MVNSPQTSSPESYSPWLDANNPFLVANGTPFWTGVGSAANPIVVSPILPTINLPGRIAPEPSAFGGLFEESAFNQKSNLTDVIKSKLKLNKFD